MSSTNVDFPWDEIVSADQAATILGVHPSTVRVWAHGGLIAHTRMGTRQEAFFLRADLAAFKRPVRARVKPGPQRATQAMFEDYADMKDHGASFDECMKRLGVKAASFMRTCERNPDHAPVLHAGAHW